MSNKITVQWRSSRTSNSRKVKPPVWSIVVPAGRGCPRRLDPPWDPKQPHNLLRNPRTGSVVDEDNAGNSDWNLYKGRFHHLQKVAFAMVSDAYVAELSNHRSWSQETDKTPTIMHTVAQMWAKPCEAMFEYIAENAPHDMWYAIAMTTMSVGMKARAARAAGLIQDSGVAIPLLSILLHNDQPMVQEGALLGLSRHMSRAEARAVVQGIADRDDVHEVIREVALDLLTMD